MKLKIILLSFSLLFLANTGFSQKKSDPQSIIKEGVAIKKYHNIDDLERMQKGELLALYEERIETLIRILPYIAFATKPGVTMSTLGIPNDKDNRKALESQFDASDEFLKTTVEFQKILLPYSDTSKLIAAILFYEETLKSLHEYAEFH
jgi:hypothetical protein